MFFNHTHPNRELSASQMEFFRMLDEKIDLVSYHTVAHATSKLFQSFFMLTKKGKRLRLARRWNTRRWSVPVSGTGPDAAASAAARPEWGENDECGEQRRPIEFVAQRRSVDLRRQDEERRPWFQVVVQRHVQRVALASVRSRPAQRSKVHGHLKDAAKREREREKSRFFLALRWHPPFAPLCSRTSRTTTSCLSLRNPRYTLSLLNHARHHHHHWKIPSNQRESERTFFFASYPHDRSALIQSPLRVVNNNKKKESTITRFGTRTTMQLAGPTMSSKPISGSRMLIMSFLSFVSQTEKIYEKLIEDRNSI